VAAARQPAASVAASRAAGSGSSAAGARTRSNPQARPRSKDAGTAQSFAMDAAALTQPDNPGVVAYCNGAVEPPKRAMLALRIVQ
jgi:hypothetical protein